MTHVPPIHRDGIEIETRPTRPGAAPKVRLVDDIEDSELHASAVAYAAKTGATVEDMKRALVGEALLATIDDLEDAGVTDADIEIDARYETPRSG